MKKTFLIMLISSSLLGLVSCGNNEDSKDVAKDQNDKKFDSTSIEDDTKFAVNIADAGMFEVESAKLALANGLSSEVKKFAQMMISDHTKAGEELKTLAVAKNISLPATMGSKHQDKYNELSKKKGADFDKDYAGTMVDGHKDVVDAFRKEAEKGNDPDLKSWALGKLPTLEHHLMMAQSTDSTVKKNK